MSPIRITTAAAVVLSLVAATAPAEAQETDHSVSSGGIMVPGWQGAVDSRAAASGQTVADSRFVETSGGYHITTGPATTYWNPANTAEGDYTVTATFTEPKYMNRNDHPHPYGLFIAGKDMGTAREQMLYCEAYGNGTFIVRGFGPEPFQMNGRSGEANPAVHKAAGKGEPVTQTISMSVKGDRVDCAINGKVVASYPRSEVTGPGKLSATDGVYGIRFAHNTEGTVTGLELTRP